MAAGAGSSAASRPAAEQVVPDNLPLSSGPHLGASVALGEHIGCEQDPSLPGQLRSPSRHSQELARVRARQGAAGQDKTSVQLN